MNDVFGQALYSYWKGDHRTPYIIRRDDGYVSKSSLKEYFYTWLEQPEEVLVPHVKGRILDVGCGAGRHVLYFQDRGYDITGIDRSPLAIKVCEEGGCQQVTQMDIFENELTPQSFDTIFLFGHNIGIGGDLKGGNKLLSILRSLIRDGGALLLTTTDVSRTTLERHLQYHQKNIQSDRYPGEIKIRVEYKDLIGDWFDWLHVEPEILEQMAESTGWKIAEAYGYFGNDYSAVLMPD